MPSDASVFIFHISRPSISCPIGCSGHGSADDGCSCDSGFAGGDCSDDENFIWGARDLVIGFAILAVAVIVSIQMQPSAENGRGGRRARNVPYSDQTATIEEEQELCSYEHPQSPPPDAWSMPQPEKSRGAKSSSSSIARRRPVSPLDAFVDDEYAASPAIIKFTP